MRRASMWSSILTWLTALAYLQDAAAKTCPSGFFSCVVGTKSSCLRDSHRCDDIVDCANGMDEEDCGKPECEAPDFFQCRNGRCISSFFRCDGENDCGDYSDEGGCGDHEHVTFAPAPCTASEWRCTDGMCIPAHWMCDGKQDCLDGSDEIQGCSHKLSCDDAFMCANKQCIPNEWVCDESSDCSDGSDEINCGTRNATQGSARAVVAAQDCTADRGLFLCNDSLNCLEFTEVCSGTAECLDGSDEGAGCSSDSCKTAGCSSGCLKTPHAPLCFCQTGYVLSGDGKTCDDKDECSEYGKCSQRCENTPGSYKCSCVEGYMVDESDAHNCKALGGEAVLFYSSKRDVMGIFLASNVKFTVGRNRLKHVIGVAYDGLNVYWTSVVDGEEAIVKSKEDGSEMESIVTAGLSMPEDLALDWITGNIYFTDSEERHVAVCSNDGALCRVLAEEEMEDKPRGLALLVEKGLLYWSRWGKHAAIMRAGMDGSDAAPLVSNNVGWPNGIAFDHPNDRLYWVDSKRLVIESVHFDGSDRRMVLQNVVRHPYSISIFENSLYWSDSGDREIFRCDKFTGKHIATVAKERKNYVYDIHVYHYATHSGTANPCLKAGCAELCLMAPNASYSCACAVGKQLAPDMHTCQAVNKKSVLVVGAGKKLFEIYHQELGRQHVFELKPKSVGEIGALAFDSLAGNVLISDIAKKRIYSLNLESNSISTIVNSSLGSVVGMDFDYLGNNLYWVDTERGTVEAMSMLTRERATILRNLGDTPLDVALVPEEGVMFVALRGLDRPHIDRYNMDGSGVATHVIEDVLRGPNIALTYDADLHRVFWADSGRSVIESTDAEGMDLHVYKTMSGSPVDLSSIGRDMFWVLAHEGDTLHWSNKYASDSKDKHISLDLDEKLNRVKLVTAGQLRSKGLHVCQKNNAGCSHLCLLAKKNTVCACPIGMRLKEDLKTCAHPARCSSDEFKCKKDDVCIKSSQRCDKHTDCPGGEDEADCDNSCSATQFHCSDGECINIEQHCDGRDDCSDQSDEKNCITNTCSDKEFQCTSGECILNQWRCDLHKDCPDNSDEESCTEATCKPKDFHCTSGACVPSSWECDGHPDCLDASDEHEGCRPPACREDEFTCSDSRCVDIELVCNGDKDCADGSDERNCSRHADVGCPPGTFFCDSAPTLCPSESERCDGVASCPGGEDERDCAGCSARQFACASGTCVAREWRCDGYDDCGDGSDEAGCDQKAGQVGSACREFTCGSGECLPLERVCDEKADCKDGSDEGGKCARVCKEGNPCSGVCSPTPSGPRCSCASGFTLAAGHACRDIDECQRGICSQFCHNTAGSFYCQCSDGYRLRSDRRSCKSTGPSMKLVFATGSQVRRTDTDLVNMEVVHSSPGREVNGLDVDVAENQLYITNRMLGWVARVDLVTKERTVLEVAQPGLVALDWVTKNIYVVDESPAEKIQLCNFQAQSCIVVVQVEQPVKVTALAVDPLHKLLFWALTSYWERAPPTAAIYRSDLSGANATEIVGVDVSLVAGLALDLATHRVFFADQHRRRVEAVDYDGTARRALFTQGIQRPVSLAMFEDYLFWLSAGSGQISRCRALGLPPRRCDEIEVHSYDAKHLVVFQDTRQPQAYNDCMGHSCAHICVPRADSTAVCMCPNATTVDLDETCPNLAMSAPDLAAVKSVSEGSGGAVAGIVVSLLLVMLVLGSVYLYRSRSNRGQLSINMHFRNPGFGFSNNAASDDCRATERLVPGQHHYGNPLNALGQKLDDVPTKKKVTIQPPSEAYAMPMFEDQDSDTESLYSDTNDKLQLVH